MARKSKNLFLALQKRLGQLSTGNNAWLRLVQPDGCIHGSVITVGCATQRASHVNPNTAQVPAVRSVLGEQCRLLFGPNVLSYDEITSIVNNSGDLLWSEKYTSSNYNEGISLIEDTLGDLVSFNKNDLMKFRNFGKKSLTELEELVMQKELNFGMDLSKYKLEKE